MIFFTKYNLRLVDALQSGGEGGGCIAGQN